MWQVKISVCLIHGSWINMRNERFMPAFFALEVYFTACVEKAFLPLFISTSPWFLHLISEGMHTVPYEDWFKSWKLKSMHTFTDAQLENTLKALSIESTARTGKRKHCFLNFQVWGSKNGGINKSALEIPVFGSLMVFPTPHRDYDLSIFL